MSERIPMQFPYGAVYFRKSNPPRQDWERDYAKAAEDGMNIFRHWFMWGSIEVAPGVYDWDDYDTHLELAAKNGIKTIIAEIDISVPEWAAARYPELLQEYRDGRKSWPEMGGSSATGGFCQGLCLDKPRAREMLAGFLTKLAERYKGHPGLLGYDVWNECNYHHGLCHCADTYKAFQEWLKAKYGDLKTLKRVWNRNTYTDFSEIRAPIALSVHPDSMDWLEFRRQKAYAMMQWRINRIRDVDKDCLVTAHGVASSLTNLAAGGSDDWTAAEKVEAYGLTWIPARRGSEPWKQWHAVDLVRSGSRGKPFWHAEMQGGPLWLQPQTTGRDRLDGRIAREQDIRIWNLTSMACGARGVLYLRWRSLLNGPLFGAFGPYDIDGGETERSRMASRLAKWANSAEQKELMAAAPVRGDIGLLTVPESQQASLLLSQAGEKDLYASMLWGAYRAYFDAGLQADFVHIDDIESYSVLYFPYPIALSPAHAESLKSWVEAGGVLVCEACPGLFSDALAMDPIQPGLGLSELFGVRQKRVEIMPDIFDDLPFELDGEELHGSGYLQTYSLTTAKARGSFEGETVAAENRYGKGKTLLIGTYLSGRYHEHGDDCVRRFFADTLEFAGKKPGLRCDVRKGDIHARVHENRGKRFLWVLNTGDSAGEAKLRLGKVCDSVRPYWGEASACRLEDGVLTVSVPPRDAVILGIESR